MLTSIVFAVIATALFKAVLPWEGVTPLFGAFLDVMLFICTYVAASESWYYLRKVDHFLGRLRRDIRRFVSEWQARTRRGEPVRVFFDLDGVLFKFMDVPFEDLYKEGHFKGLPVQENILKAMESLAENPLFEVYTASSYLADSPYALKEKCEALQKVAPWLNWEHKIFIPYGQDKVKHIPKGIKRSDILVDDFGPNCTSWEEAGGKYVKVSRNKWDKTYEMTKHETVISPDDTQEELLWAIKEKARMEPWLRVIPKVITVNGEA